MRSPTRSGGPWSRYACLSTFQETLGECGWPKIFFIFWVGYQNVKRLGHVFGEHAVLCHSVARERERERERRPQGQGSDREGGPPRSATAAKSGTTAGGNFFQNKGSRRLSERFPGVILFFRVPFLLPGKESVGFHRRRTGTHLTAQ